MSSLGGFGNLPLALVVFDDEGVITSWSEGMRRLTGIPAPDAVNRTLLSVEMTEKSALLRNEVFSRAVALASQGGGFHGQEFGPRDLDHALQVIDAHPAVLLIFEKRHDNRGLDWIVEHSRHPLRHVTLDALGTDTMRWDQLMQDNLKRLHP